MDNAAIKLRTGVLGPLFVRMAMMGIPCVLAFTPGSEYEVAIVPDIDSDKPEDAGLVMAAMIGNRDVHFVQTSDGEMLVVHKEDA